MFHCVVLSCGVTSPFCLWPTSMVIKREKIRNQNRKCQLQTGGSASFHLEPRSFPTNIFFHGSEGAQSPRLAVERNLWQWSSDFLQQNNSARRKRRFLDPNLRDAQLVGLRWGTGICLKCANLRKPWCRRPLDHTWWSSPVSFLVYISHKSLTTDTSLLFPRG